MLKTNGKFRKKFRRSFKKANKEIKQHLEKASAELQKAMKISEQYGIPFYSNISFLRQNFKPKTFGEKWNKLDDEFLEQVIELPEYEGWQYSRVCY